jgi:two-component sensor histidine kinase
MAMMMKEFYVISVLLLMNSTVKAQKTPGEALQHSYQAQNAHHFGEAKTSAQTAIEGYLKAGRPDSLGEAYVALWRASSSDGLNYAGRIPILDNAQQAFEQAGNRRRRADVLTDEAELYGLTDSAPTALHMALQALQLYQAVHYPKLQQIYNVLNGIYTQLGDYDEALRSALLCIHTAEATGDTSASVSAFYNHLAVSHSYLREFDEAETALRKALEIAMKYRDTASIVSIAGNLESILSRNNEFGKAYTFYSGMLAAYPEYFARDTIWVAIRWLEIYNGLKQFNKGEPYVGILKRFTRQEEASTHIRMEAALRLSKYYMYQGRFDTARSYLDEYSAMAKKYKVAQAALVAPYYYFWLDSLSGHYLNAIRDFKLYKKASDSNLNVAKKRQLVQYSALYETDKKDQSILQLKHQADVQESRLRQEVFLRRMTIVGVVLLLMLVSLLYYAYRIKQRSNRLLAAQRKEIDQKNLRLERLVTEKEFLVKEIHHRVKNNLYLITSLLESQSAYLHDEALFEIQKSQHRVEAISMIHQKLFLNGQLADVEMSTYLGEIVGSLRDSLVTNQDLTFSLDLDPIHLDVSKAVPLGLIVNEAVTNAVKYAFPHNKAGKIGVTLKQGPAQDYSLCIKDNGVGLPPDYDMGQSKSLGMSLIEGLSRALQAALRIHSGPGTTIELVFVGVHEMA